MLFLFQAEDGIRDLVRSRGLGDVYKRQGLDDGLAVLHAGEVEIEVLVQAAADVDDRTLLALSLIHI